MATIKCQYTFFVMKPQPFPMALTFYLKIFWMSAWVLRISNWDTLSSADRSVAYVSLFFSDLCYLCLNSLSQPVVLLTVKTMLYFPYTLNIGSIFSDLPLEAISELLQKLPSLNDSLTWYKTMICNKWLDLTNTSLHNTHAFSEFEKGCDDSLLDQYPIYWGQAKIYLFN